MKFFTYAFDFHRRRRRRLAAALAAAGLVGAGTLLPIVAPSPRPPGALSAAEPAGEGPQATSPKSEGKPEPKSAAPGKAPSEGETAKSNDEVAKPKETLREGETAKSKDEAKAKETPAGAAKIVSDAPTVQVLVPGFSVRELPVQLTNLNNIEYAPDGRLFAAGYDGRLHLLRDEDGDGLESSVVTFQEAKSDDYPLGMAFHAGALYVVRKNHIARHRDADGDGVPETVEKAAEWKGAETHPLFRDARRVSGGFALAIDPSGNFYLGIGSLNTFKAYMLLGPDGNELKPYDLAAKEAKSTYRLDQPHGVVLKISADGKKTEIVSTGVRYPVSMQFNRKGDLFCTDQEGATWLPNGNPFDELLHIQTGRHFGFPPRHPRYLPSVVDEPSVFDYAPQHQSTCGFRFNAPVGPQGKRFGPPSWLGDAFVTGESRGKLYRTKVISTEAGYVASNQLFACLNMLPVDVAFSPQGDLVVACHSGGPDWGSGPGGPGKLFKISYTHTKAPLPVVVWAASSTETRVAFDQPLNPAEWSTLRTESRIERGRYVAAGDRFERVRPGYAVVQMQQRSERVELPILSAALSADGRTAILRTLPRKQAFNYSLVLPYPAQVDGDSKVKPVPKTLGRAGGIDLAFDLTGVEALWKSKDGKREWSGWLPHLDAAVSSELLRDSAETAALAELQASEGTVAYEGAFDLSSMLRAAVQPGSKLDYEPAPETVVIRFASSRPLELSASVPAEKTIRESEVKYRTTATVKISGDGRIAELVVENPKPDFWTHFLLTASTGPDVAPLAVSWRTADDPRPRALPLRRTFLPWAKPLGAAVATETQEIPEIKGGDWAAGRKLFFSDRGQCHKCHTMRGEGGKVGPDLSNVIHRDYASVLKDVLQPSAAINPDFLAYQVELDDGRVFLGVTNGSDAETLRLTDQTGKQHAFARGAVAELAPSRQSGMPEKLLEPLAPQEVKDLMTYLLREKP